jgi:hypothetical protein
MSEPPNSDATIMTDNSDASLGPPTQLCGQEGDVYCPIPATAPDARSLQ